MANLTQLYREAAEKLEAIAAIEKADAAMQLRLADKGFPTFKRARPSDDAEWAFYKALTRVVEGDPADTFADLCQDAGVDEDGYPTDGYTRMSDEEWDYKSAKMGSAFL